MAVIILTFVQAGAGVINVLVLASMWMQITHLFIAESLWIALVFLTAELIVFEPAKVIRRLEDCPNYSPGVRPAASSSSAPANR